MKIKGNTTDITIMRVLLDDANGLLLIKLLGLVLLVIVLLVIGPEELVVV